MDAAEIYRCLAGDGTDIWELGFRTSADDEPLALATLDANFACQLTVGSVNRAVTLKNDDNTRFRIALTGAETAALGVGNHVVNMRITNATLSPPLAKSKQVMLRIS